MHAATPIPSRKPSRNIPAGPSVTVSINVPRRVIATGHATGTSRLRVGHVYTSLYNKYTTDSSKVKGNQ